MGEVRCNTCKEVHKIEAEKEVNFAWFIIGHAKAVVNDYGEVYTDKEKRISKIILDEAKRLGLYSSES